MQKRSRDHRVVVCIVVEQERGDTSRIDHLPSRVEIILLCQKVGMFSSLVFFRCSSSILRGGEEKSKQALVLQIVECLKLFVEARFLNDPSEPVGEKSASSFLRAPITTKSSA